MAVPKPCTAAMLAVLADGCWHDREELVAVGAPLVPPGFAYRYGENERNRQHQRPDGIGPRVRGNDQTSIAAGRRRSVVGCLYGQVRRGKLEQRRVGDRTMYRLSVRTAAA